MRGVALSVLALAASASFALAKDEAEKPVFKVCVILPLLVLALTEILLLAH
jgi:hypothetical protein